jgi:putative tryptophan/tyrosine transport system substrate-binding protein
MKRRVFITLISGAAAWPLSALAQQSRRLPRLCVLAPDSQSSPWGTRYAGFIQGLRDLGYIVGKDILIDFLSTDGGSERFPALADECVKQKPDIIVAYTTPGGLAAKKATSTIPIVVGPVGDPVGTGIVASLARPGGNITALTVMGPELSGKRLQLFKETIPTLSRVAVLSQLADPIGPLQVRELEEAAKPMGLHLQIHDVRTTDDLAPVFEMAAKSGAQGLLTTLETFFIVRRARIAELAAQYRLPAMFTVRDFAEAGGLMSYGPSTLSLYSQTAAQVDKILKGSKPADLPVEQPTKFEFIINLNTARTLGLAIPPGVLAIADEVIE